MTDNDERVIRNMSEETNSGREDRGLSDESRTGEDGTVLTLRQRKALLRQNMMQDILPKITDGEPDMHYCWLSTTNSTDPIYKRLQLGYELVKATELPSLAQQFTANSGQFEGCISINEMVLAKIHIELYREMMTILHHEKPLQEEELLKANAILEDADSEGERLGRYSPEDTGFKSLARRHKAPIF